MTSKVHKGNPAHSPALIWGAAVFFGRSKKKFIASFFSQVFQHAHDPEGALTQNPGEGWLFEPKEVQHSSFCSLDFEKCRRGDLVKGSELFQSTQKNLLPSQLGSGLLEHQCPKVDKPQRATSTRPK